MGDRMKSTFDGAMVGFVSGMLTELISWWLGGSPVNSPRDTILTGLVAGALVGFVALDVIRFYGVLGGMMTAFGSVALMISGAMPFFAAMHLLGAARLTLPFDAIFNWALIWLLVAGLTGVFYQGLLNYPGRVPEVAPQTQT